MSVALIGLTSGACFIDPIRVGNDNGDEAIFIYQWLYGMDVHGNWDIAGYPFLSKIGRDLMDTICAIQFAGATSLAAAACMFAIRFLLDKRLLSKL
ncbi:hypothetical protein O0I10_009091 [Lichtheimia ornata]|uniref:Uncharacterized protein n=1 Tax=Lichtheimia ornata TaxID=688661 RepID=A0AAD7XW63_9FUNG|nr:uncharacterized protein O0I10_009091 [Lichtheimia ornata]KAJ8655223.1 hypothetical protein O0I10_009091 [Lichtheimia ornata]